MVFRVSVDANSPTPPAGKVDLTIKTSDGGSIAQRSARATEVLWTKTINYNGGASGPSSARVLTRGHHYTATRTSGRSTPTFKRCRASEAFAVDSDR